jgi:DNA invertase Pin-like site-specific DNA recombinase
MAKNRATPSGFMMNVLGAAAEFESDLISERTHLGTYQAVHENDIRTLQSLQPRER